MGIAPGGVIVIPTSASAPANARPPTACCKARSRASSLSTSAIWSLTSCVSPLAPNAASTCETVNPAIASLALAATGVASLMFSLRFSISSAVLLTAKESCSTGANARKSSKFCLLAASAWRVSARSLKTVLSSDTPELITGICSMSSPRFSLTVVTEPAICLSWFAVLSLVRPRSPMATPARSWISCRLAVARSVSVRVLTRFLPLIRSARWSTSV